MSTLVIKPINIENGLVSNNCFLFERSAFKWLKIIKMFYKEKKNIEVSIMFYLSDWDLETELTRFLC